ncbi:MAG TPA: UDP-N-acetylmuramoyl-L-alanine--D-glutamate ligase [bacterium]|nr:UDP-N-acetylmuramoyl-L-alanine--D-glutamate ligase [bacterium]HPP30101.1 UDP-N-acetylmuramoyl-L-alanine--D-glutamate ligase [bacterium]
MDIKNKKVVVAGMGTTGRESALFLSRKGADVFLTETKATEQIQKEASLLNKKGIKTEIGGHTEKFLAGMEILVVSPGVPDEALPVKYAESRNIPIISEIELAFIFSPTKKIIAITGTDGKTTTTALTGAILRKAGIPAVVCGNIGNPFIGELENVAEDVYVVLEVSSFQLERTKSFKPFIGCLLNIAEDHFDRHHTMKNYVEAKKKAFINQDKNDFAVFNYNDSYCREIAREVKAEVFFFGYNRMKEKGVYAEGDNIFSNIKDIEEIINIRKTKLWGKGNTENVMASALIGLLCDLSPEHIREAIYTFTPLPHRLERVGEINGVLFINDSKSTNPHSVINALDSIEDNTATILIMGGRNKDMSFSSVLPHFKKKVVLIILMGEAKEELAEEFKNSGVPLILVDTVKDAVRQAFKSAKSGNIVMFSPGCTSFDMFNNYKERGDAFKKEVFSLL